MLLMITHFTPHTKGKAMDNQHQKIKGYRDLSQAEIDMMNEIKAAGVRLESLIVAVGNHLTTQKNTCGPEALNAIYLAQPDRWVAIARTDIQTALMALTRAVAQPTSF